MTWVKYKVQKKQEYIQGSGWQDVTPLETRNGDMIDSYPTFKDCSGYDLKYRTIYYDVDEDYICNTCPNLTRTVTSTTCTNGNKYLVTSYYTSNDIGETWTYSGQTRELIEEKSADCGYSARTISTGSGCTGYDLYEYFANQESYDSGATWATTSTTSTLIESNSEECGAPRYRWVEMPIGEDYACNVYSNKYYAFAYASSNSGFTVNCNSSSSMTSSEEPVYSSDYSNDIHMIRASFGNCITSIGDGVLQFNEWYSCMNTLEVYIPDNVTSIGRSAFQLGHKGADSSNIVIYIGSGITSIGDGAIYAEAIDTSGYGHGDASVKVTINRATPPTLGTGAIRAYGLNTSVRIYVPSGSVETYKAAPGWSAYSSNISAITAATPNLAYIYKKQKQQVSYDKGVTWTDTGTITNSSTLGYISINGCQSTKEWVNSSARCIDGDKHITQCMRLTFGTNESYTDCDYTREIIEEDSPDC